jgi:lysophospholipase L1-like esterase
VGTRDLRARRARRALIAVAFAFAALTGVATPASAAPTVPIAAAAPADGAYVALGDSFTAGPLIPNQLGDPLGCLRSDRDYPHLVARSLQPAAFRDVSCSGADTGDMTGSQGVTPGPNPPQFDALDASTTLVTLGIGGNDIGFGGIVESCLALFPWDTPCQRRFVVNGVDELARRIQETAPDIAATLAGIRQRAPQARVLVVGYPSIVPDQGVNCWPVLPLGWGDIDYLRRTTKALNAMLAAQAGAAGATYVDTYTPSIGRDACASSTRRWVEPLIPIGAAPVHPNARGMQGMADAVLRALT